MDDEPVITADSPVLRIRMQQGVKVKNFTKFNGKRSERIKSKDESHESLLEVSIKNQEETVIKWTVKGAGGHVCVDVDVWLSILADDAELGSIIYEQPFTEYVCSLNGRQGYLFTLPKKKITDHVEESDSVLFMVDYQIMSVTRPAVGNVLTEPTVFRFLPKSADFYMKPEYSDVKFVIGKGNEFHGNRTIISMRNKSFEKMLFPLSENSEKGCHKEKEILLPEASWPAFLTIMRFIYREELVIDKRFIKEILHAAETYDVREVVFAISCLMDVDMLPYVINHAHEAKTDRLADVWGVCLEENLAQFLVPEKFILLSCKSVIFMIQDTKLKIRHDLMWNLCVAWAKHQCKTKGNAEPQANDLRSVMLPFLYEIRYHTMSFAEFTSGPASSGILNLKEAMAIYRILILNIHHEAVAFGPDLSFEEASGSEFDDDDLVPQTDL